MSPLDFYDLGVGMASTARTEAQERTAINRLYYGLHHEVCCRYFRKESWAQPLNRNRPDTPTSEIDSTRASTLRVVELHSCLRN